MSTTRTHRRVASLVAAMVMLLPVALLIAEEHGDRNRPVEITFTKWVTTFPLMKGYWGDDLANEFVGEVFQRQVSQLQADNCFLPAPNCGRIIRLEALYEVHNGDRSFTALIRGGTSGDTGAALVARRSPGACGISDHTWHDGRLRGRTAGRDVLPGNDPRRASSTRLSLTRARRRVIRCGWVAQMAAQPVSARATSAPRTNVRPRPCWPGLYLDHGVCCL